MLETIEDPVQMAFQKSADLDLQCLQKSIYPACFSMFKVIYEGHLESS